MSDKPLILLDPHPRTIDLLFTDQRQRLDALGNVLWYDGQPAPDAYIDEHLPEAVALVGQTAMPKERIERAPKLRAVMNVEGNFLPNIDYRECHRRNIHVLACAPAFSPAVAEMALGMALALARGIVEHDAMFRRGEERYSAASNQETLLLRGATFGLLGCGNVGRALLPLLQPFGGRVMAHDPWLHEHVLEQMGAVPVGLEQLLTESEVLFLISAVTTENTGMLGARELAMLRRNTCVVLVGRSDVADFDALLDAAEEGRIRAAIDVFPQEPVPADARVRRVRNIILSGHRAGGIPHSYREIGRMVVDDLELILRRLPPQRMQLAAIEIVDRYRSNPVSS